MFLCVILHTSVIQNRCSQLCAYLWTSSFTLKMGCQCATSQSQSMTLTTFSCWKVFCSLSAEIIQVPEKSPILPTWERRLVTGAGRSTIRIRIYHTRELVLVWACKTFLHVLYDNVYIIHFYALYPSTILCFECVSLKYIILPYKYQNVRQHKQKRKKNFEKISCTISCNI